MPFGLCREIIYIMKSARNNPKSNTILVTGSAGFIGFHTSLRLLKLGYKVVGVDNLNDYYDIRLKQARNGILKQDKNYTFYKLNIADLAPLEKLFKKYHFDYVIHLAAQAGVRYSLTNPHVYQESNLAGMLNVLECARSYQPQNLLFASSSSVYGSNKPGKNGFSESDQVDNPISLYAATKKADELMAFTYHHLFKLNITGFRFFTVYGPWGRPDMAYFSFTDNLYNDTAIKVFNRGKMWRDFTYVDDIVDGLVKSMTKPLGYEIINLGNNKPVVLSYFIEVLEKLNDRQFNKIYEPMQPGDVLKTHANINKAQKILGYQPKTSIEKGLKEFAKWYKMYYKK